MRCKDSISKIISGKCFIFLMVTLFCSTLCLSDPLTPVGQPIGTDLIANAGGPYNGNVEQVIWLDGSGSSDNNGSIISYEWNYGDGETGIWEGAFVFHQYSSAGQYVATLTVISSNGATSSDTTTVTITEPPIDISSITISNLTYPQRVTSVDPVTIYAAVIGENPIFTVTLRWNNGTEDFEKEMTANGDIYSTTIGPFVEGKTIEFQIEAIDIKQEQEYHSGRFEVAEPSAVEEIDSVVEGEEKEVEMEGTSISKITFQPKEDLHNVKIIIEHLTPEEIKEKSYSGEGQKVYWYFNLRITANDTYVPENDIESSTIEFKVEKNWAYESKTDEMGRKYNLSDISLYRYKDNSWEKFTTTIISEEYETYILYIVEVPGYSTFAVVGSKVLEKEETFQEEPEIPWIIIIGVVIAAIIILLIVLVKARYIYKDEESKKK